MINPLHPNPKHNDIATIGRVRLMLCEHIALALCILVAADVLDTVIKPVHAYLLEDVTKMGFVTILRTGIAYFLAREVKELEWDHAPHSPKNANKRNTRGSSGLSKYDSETLLHSNFTSESDLDCSGTGYRTSKDQGCGNAFSSSRGSENDLFTASVDGIFYDADGGLNEVGVGQQRPKSE
jgi:uncharacterized membrane protein